MGHKNTFQPQNVCLISVEADEREVSALYSEGMRKEGGGGEDRKTGQEQVKMREEKEPDGKSLNRSLETSFLSYGFNFKRYGNP